MPTFSLLHYAIVFLVVALIAAAVGFGGVAGVAMEGARLLFWVFIVLVCDLTRRQPGAPRLGPSVVAASRLVQDRPAAERVLSGAHENGG
jgi:uncharacterized membrane protein YtjA (UPF0391 family)